MFGLSKHGPPDGKVGWGHVLPWRCLGTGQQCFSRTPSGQIPGGNMENNHFPRMYEVPGLAAPEKQECCQSWGPGGGLKSAVSRRDEWSSGLGLREEGGAGGRGQEEGRDWPEVPGRLSWKTAPSARPRWGSWLGPRAGLSVCSPGGRPGCPAPALPGEAHLSFHSNKAFNRVSANWQEKCM